MNPPADSDAFASTSSTGIEGTTTSSRRMFSSSIVWAVGGIASVSSSASFAYWSRMWLSWACRRPISSAVRPRRARWATCSTSLRDRPDMARMIARRAARRPGSEGSRSGSHRPGEEVPGALVARVVEELGRGAGLDEHPLVDEVDPIGGLPGEGHLVGHDDHRRALVGQLLHHLQDLADQRRVESRRRLVEEEDPRLHRERPGDRDPLLLAARQAPWVLVALLRQADFREVLLRRRDRIGPGDALDPDRRLDQVVDHVEMRKQVELLEDHLGTEPDLPDLLAVTGVARVERVGLDGQAVDLDRPDGRLLEKVDTAEQRALAGAGPADQADRLAGVDLERDTAEDVIRAVELLQVDGPDHRRCPGRGQVARRGERVVDGRRSDTRRPGHSRTSLSAIRFSSRSWKSEKKIVRPQ